MWIHACPMGQAFFFWFDTGILSGKEKPRRSGVKITG